jgi:glycosyltransferase involved in cell wall biosynthesis
VDPNITNWRGHYAQYALTVHGELAARGITCHVLANQEIEADLARSMDAVPAFKHGISHTFGGGTLARPLDLLRSNLGFRHDLAASLPSTLSDGDIVFAPNVHQRDLMGWATFLSRRTTAPGTTVLLLRYDPFGHAGKHPGRARRAYVRLCFQMLEGAARHRPIRLASDSDLLAGSYGDVTSLPIEVFPVPHTEHYPAPRSPSGSTVRMALLGEARLEKGLDTLVDAVTILSRSGRLDGIEVVVQNNLNQAELSRSEPVMDRLRALDDPRVTLLAGPLDEGAYQRELLAADVILLPYREELYGARTSGPFVEALAAGRPVVVSAGTWMSEQLRRFGAGVQFRGDSPEDLGRAMEASRSRLGELSQKAADGRGEWLARHNPGALVDQLLGSAGGATHA